MNQPKYKHGPEVGAKFAVEYARTAKGAYPAEVYLGELDLRTRAKLDALIERFSQLGEIRNKEQFKLLKGGNQLFEFKHYQARVVGYYAPRQGAIVLTHGFTKQSNDTPSPEIERAKRIREEYERYMQDEQQRPKPRR